MTAARGSGGGRASVLRTLLCALVLLAVGPVTTGTGTLGGGALGGTGTLGGAGTLGGTGTLGGAGTLSGAGKLGGGGADRGAVSARRVVTNAVATAARNDIGPGGAIEAAGGSDAGTQSADAESAVPSRALTYQPIELRFTASAPITAVFTSPRGTKLELGSFPRAGSQRIRFTPTEPGTWRFDTAGAITRHGAIAVRTARSHGFIRTRGHAFRFEDGTPFIALGENRINIYDRSWNWGTLDIEEYIEHMARNGMTVLRVFIVSDIENEERGGRNAGVLEPAVGRFDEAVAQQFDRIFHSAQAHGIYVVLVAFALGFSEDDAWKSWQDNPYSRERGGPANTRYDFFDSPAVRHLAAGRIRYLAARYASSPNLLAIDLLNEPEWDGAIPETSWRDWAQEMARVWAQADPYDHPVTVGSVGLHWNIEGDERDWWSTSACDVVQWHLYGKEYYDVHALATEMTRKVRETWDFGKPVLVGEFAYGGEAKPAYDHTHVGLWSAIFSGAGVLAHSAPPFNVDSDELMTSQRARHFRTLRAFLDGMPELSPGEVSVEGDASEGDGSEGGAAQGGAAQGGAAQGGAAQGGASAWALTSHAGNAAAVWLLAPKASYDVPMRGVRVQLSGVANGRWRVEWVDDVTGRAVGSSNETAAGGRLNLTAPPFTAHVAARLRRLER